MRRRRYLIPLIVVAVALAIGLALFLRKSAPPEPVRLLPEAQAYLYVNLHPLRMADIKMAPVQLDPEYDRFVKETGFQFERDLDEAALAVHVPPANGTGPKENRFSEVFVGHFENEKVRSYLNRLSSRIDSYRDLEVFNIPHEDRTVRLVILGPDLVAVSNAEDPLVIRGIVDRYKKVALPFGGPPLVKQYYRKLPFGTVAWAIADIARGSSQNKAIVMPGGFDLFFPPDTVAVASVRYLGSIDLKAEALTTSDTAAQRITDQVNAFLGLFRMLESNASGSDPDVQTFFDSVKVQQNGKNAVLTAELPKGFLKKVLTEPPPEAPAAAPAPAASPRPEPKTKHKRRP
jgi:hypothetical protein